MIPHIPRWFPEAPGVEIRWFKRKITIFWPPKIDLLKIDRDPRGSIGNQFCVVDRLNISSIDPGNPVFDQQQGYIRSIGPILRAITISFRSPIDSRGSRLISNVPFLFGHLSVRFSLFNHHISSPGTSENHRKTCGERSWRYGYDPVHIAYPSTRNTSENRRSFFPKNLTFVSQIVPTIHLPEMGFPA